MKSLLIAAFAFIGWTTYANGTQKDIVNPIQILEVKKVDITKRLENKKVLQEPKKSLKISNEVAFQYYYTMDWLYEETPFIYKLEVLV